ncbi:hypothetical protein [Methanogenium cariaci]|uniref:hypothetical protein n=1 Tax=Methanogenium cariaci TaxID=2197 RepID=UPI0012F6AD9D|nr:hypothetical protein [Methanogenium cariaci]
MIQYNLSPSLIARYFYHNCDRYLRYHATPPVPIGNGWGGYRRKMWKKVPLPNPFWKPVSNGKRR